ncbi:putative rna binding protein [Golovinomyces cichoracearum]|uniref:Putative rna binding protein n=1 Tax=Golovinomyces cichoracearum TaxID=62708 RepID=A0A420JAP1_9PEZI|nr:putative rna binding protein [Golovinomyces cichoracearum]
MSPRSQHPTLGYLPTAQSLTRSGASTSNNSPTETPGSNLTHRPPFTISGNHSTGNKMANNSRSGAGSPSHDSGGANRIFSKRAREIKAQEGVQVNVWGPPTSGNSTPLRENIPESPTDGFPDYSNQSVQETKSNNTIRRARAGTVPSRFSPGGMQTAKTILPSVNKTARQTPPSSFKSPSPVSGENAENRNAALLSRLRSGTMPQRSQYTPSSAGPFGPSVFSTNWSSGRDRTSTMASTTSQGSYNPTSPSQSAFSREAVGDNDMQMRTLDYLGLADTPQPPRATLANPLLANIANINKQANRFRSYSVNAKEKYAEDEEQYASGSMTPFEAQQAQLHMQIAATHAAIQQHNLAVQAYANQASVNRPRARTAGILESPASKILQNHYQNTSRLENNINSTSIGMNEDYEDLPSNVAGLSLGNSNGRNECINPDEKSEGPTRALWLGSIPLSTTVSTLTEIFKHYGSIISARVLTHKNCGFVNFERLESAISAKAHMNGKEIFPGAGPIRINFAKPPSCSGTPENETHFPPTSPDLFVSGDKETDTDVNSSGISSRLGAPLAVPLLAEIKQDILRIVGEFGASHEEKSKIACSIDASIMFTRYESEIPSIPEPSHNRIHDAPKLRDIRKRIDSQNLSPAEMEYIASGILPEIVELSSDYLGNTVVQKLFEYCSDDVRDLMLAEIAPHIAEIGVHKNGTWAAQKIIDVCKTPKQMGMIVKNLHPYVVPLFLDQYGNYVLQCCLKFGSPFNDFIFESMLSQIWEIAQGRYGARAMRACLESHHSTKEQQRMLASTIALHSVQLATSANGALLLTWFLDTCTFPQRRSVLAPQLIPHLVHLCTHKVAYLTVLKGINQKQEPEAKDKIYKAIFFSPNDEVLKAILSDHACGATLIFKVLTTPFFDESIRSEVVENVRKVLIRLKAQPGQGYKRLMDEVGLSARGANNGISREHSSNSVTERTRLSSNQSQATNIQRVPQKYGSTYVPQMPISDLDLALARPSGIDPNLQPYLPYSPMFNNPLFSPINLQQLQYQQSLLVRSGSPMNNMQINNHPGYFGLNGGSPGPDHFRNQNSHPLTNMSTNIPPGFSGISTPGLGNFGHAGVNGSGMSYGLQSPEPQVNERSRRA